MVEQIEPTMEEIVVALRETRRGAGRPPPFTVVPGRGMNDRGLYAAPNGETRGVGRGHASGADASNERTSTDIDDLRDAEIERLLAENARCNERIMFLLKVIEHERLCNARAGTVATEMDREAIVRDVKASLDAELRPVLLVLHRLIEKQQQVRTAGGSVRPSDAKASRPAAPAEPSGWIADMGRELDSCGEALAWKVPPGDMPQPNFRQRVTRALDALYGWSGPGITSLRRGRQRVSNDP